MGRAPAPIFALYIYVSLFTLMVSSARVAHTDTNGEALNTILLASGTLHCVEDVVSCGLTEASGQDVGSQGIDAAAWQQTRWVGGAADAIGRRRVGVWRYVVALANLPICSG